MNESRNRLIASQIRPISRPSCIESIGFFFVYLMSTPIMVVVRMTVMSVSKRGRSVSWSWNMKNEATNGISQIRKP
jgi:hypothetical protein